MAIQTTPARPQPGTSAAGPTGDVPATAYGQSPQLPTGGSPAGSASGPGSATATAASPTAAAVPPLGGLAVTATGWARPWPAARSLRSCQARHQYSGAYRATISSPSRYSPGPWVGPTTIFGEFQPPKM